MKGRLTAIIARWAAWTVTLAGVHCASPATTDPVTSAETAGSWSRGADATWATRAPGWELVASSRGVDLRLTGDGVAGISRAVISRGASYQAMAGAFEPRADGTLLARSGRVTEELARVPMGVEQRWRFDAAPAGDGDLTVAVGLRGFEVDAIGDGGALLVARASGRWMTYGHGTWIDARGRRTRVEVTAAQGGLALRVPDEVLRETAWPAVLDPMVSPLLVPGAPAPTRVYGTVQGFVASSHGSGEVIAAWNLPSTSTTNEIWSQRFSDTGAFLRDDARLVSAAVAGTARAIHDDPTGSLLVYNDGATLYARHLGRNGRPDAAAVVVGTGLDATNSAVAADFDGVNHLVVWSTGAASGSFRSARVSTAGALVDATPRAFGSVTGATGRIELARHGVGHLLVWSQPTVGVTWLPLAADGTLGAGTLHRAFSFPRSMTPFAVASSGREAMIAWNDNTTTGSLAPGGYSLRVDASGDAVDAAPRPLTDGGRQVAWFQGSLVWDGRAWRTFAGVTASGAWRVALIDGATGAMTGTSFLFATTGALPGSTLVPTDRGALLLYTAPPEAGVTNSVLYAQSIPFTGAPGGVMALSRIQPDEANHYASFDGSSFVVTLFRRTDFTPTPYHVYLARISRDGAQLDTPALDVSTAAAVTASVVPRVSAAYSLGAGTITLRTYRLNDMFQPLTPALAESTSSWGSDATFLHAVFVRGADGFLLAGFDLLDPYGIATMRVHDDGTLVARGAPLQFTRTGGPGAAAATRSSYLVAWPVAGSFGACGVQFMVQSPAGDLFTPMPVYAPAPVTGPSCATTRLCAASDGAGYVLVARTASTGTALAVSNVGATGVTGRYGMIPDFGTSTDFDLVHDGTGYLLVWAEPRGIFAQYLDPTVPALVGARTQITEAFSPLAGPSAGVTLATDGAGRTLIAWRERVVFNSRVFARIFASDGAPPVPDAGAPDARALDATTVDATTPDVARVDTPTVDTPTVDTPTVDTSVIDTPSVDLPSTADVRPPTPDVVTPDVVTPDVVTPDVVTPDASVIDATTVDAESADARGVADADVISTADVSSADRGVVDDRVAVDDAIAADHGAPPTELGVVDDASGDVGAAPPSSRAGCGCHTTTTTRGGAVWFSLAAVMVAARRRRPRRAARGARVDRRRVAGLLLAVLPLVFLGCEAHSLTMPSDDGGVTDTPSIEDRSPVDVSPDGPFSTEDAASDVSVGSDTARVDVTPDIPVVDVPVVDAPVVDAPVVDAPVVDVPVVDAPVVDVPVVDVPRADVPVIDVPTVDVPTDVVRADSADVPVDGGVPADVPAGCGGGPACAAGLACCGGACADTRTSMSHCGGCGRPCDVGSVCAAGVCSLAPSPTDLRIDVPTFAFAGTLTVQSSTAPWTRGCITETPARLTLLNAATGMQFSVSLQCPGEGAPFGFSTRVVPGVYQITLVTRELSYLVGGVDELIDGAFDLQRDRADVAFDVRNAEVSGTVTINGARPMNCVSTFPNPVGLTFVDTAGRSVARATASCIAGMPERFSVRIPPGTYRVRATNVDPRHPSMRAWAEPTMVVTGDRSDVALDVRLFTVSGTISMNGTTPLSLCSGSPRATISFVAPDQTAVAHDVPCGSGAFTYSLLLGADTYLVRVEGRTSAFPQGSTVVAPAFVVDRDITQSFNVRAFPVQLAIQSVTPTSAWRCDTGIKAHFVDTTLDQNVDLTLGCGTRPTFSGNVYAGTYDVGIDSYASSSYQIRVLSGVSVAASRPDLTASLTAQRVSGRITWFDPMTYACPLSPPRYLIGFYDASTKQYAITTPVCAGAAASYQVDLFPGTYQAFLSGVEREVYSTGSLTVDSLTTGSSGAFDVSVRSVPISGTLFENGMIPQTLCATTSSAVSVRFAERTSGGNVATIDIPCRSPGASYPFTGRLLPGVYRVSVAGIGHGGYSPMFEVYPAVRIM